MANRGRLAKRALLVVWYIEFIQPGSTVANRGRMYTKGRSDPPHHVIKKYKYHNCGVIFRKTGSKTVFYDIVARVLFKEVMAMATMLKMVKEQKLSRRQRKRTQKPAVCHLQHVGEV